MQTALLALALAGLYQAEDPAAPVESYAVQQGPDGWVSLKASKRDGGRYQLWIRKPAAPTAYVVKEGEEQPRAYRQAQTGAAVLPSLLAWRDLLPARDGAYLGHRYRRAGDANEPWSLPANVRTVPLRPDMQVGPASNARPKDDTRRWDLSDYGMVRFTRDDYRLLAEAGVNCVRVDDEQLAWADSLGLFYWGAGAKLPYPEMLYRSQYLGPALFLDEPAVGTRDHILRSRLSKDPAFRKSITVADAFSAFRDHYAEVLAKGAPQSLARMLAGRKINTGSLDLRQRNLYSWETMVDTAAWQLTREPGIPEAFVFEPPGRIGTRRTLPEFNMTYGTQFAYDDTRALTGILFSFLRGAARAAGKNWGISIYGAVDRSDAPLWLTQAYDMGATRFHFWDNYQLACVPFREYTALARHLRNHADSRPPRDLDRLRRAAEVAITLPPGYGLGHVQTGRGNLWGIGELNLERRNTKGLPYRAVMSNFFLEAERCLREGMAFDALWQIQEPKGYRQVIRIGEEMPARAITPKPGRAPRLAVSVTVQNRTATAIARVSETDASVYYTHGTDNEGVYRNAMVLWELYGPDGEDYLQVMPEGMRPNVKQSAQGEFEVTVQFPLPQPGRYRLRAATVDTAGRRSVVWTPITVN